MVMHSYDGTVLHYYLLFEKTMFGSDLSLPHPHKNMKPFAFTKPHDFRVFSKEYSW